MFHAIQIELKTMSQSSGHPGGSAGVTCGANGSNLDGIQLALILVVQGGIDIPRASGETIGPNQQFRGRDHMHQCGGMQDRTPDSSEGQRVVKDLLGVEARAKQVQEGSSVRTIRLHARRIKHRHASDGG